MAVWTYLALCVVLFALAEAKPGHFSNKQKLLDRLARRGLIKRDECKAAGATCTGYAWDNCCDVCYWAEGRKLYYPGQEGECVSCIDTGLKCQFDWQCCSGTVCHREGRVDTNGECGAKRGPGEHCHEDDNCLSGDCDLNWHLVDGECT